MALKLNTQYPGRFDPVSTDYPQGKWRNRSSSTANDGGYLEEAHMNDIYGFFGALLRNAEIVPDGTVDTARKSQFYEALIAVAKKVVVNNEYIFKSTKNELDNVDKSNLFNGQRATISNGVEYKYNSTEKLWYPVDSMILHNKGNTSTESQVDIANFPDVRRRAFVTHHYNDAEMFVLDNVGERNVFLQLNNARNPRRRVDKPSDFLGSADFLRCTNLVQRTDGSYMRVNTFEVMQNGDLVWGHKSSLNKPVSFINNQITNDGYSFELKSSYRRDELLLIESETGKNALEIKNVNSLITTVKSGAHFLNGIVYGSEKGQVMISAENGFGVMTLECSTISMKDENGKYYNVLRRNPMFTAPNPDSPGKVGEVAYIGGYMYVCVLINKWNRVKMEESW